MPGERFRFEQTNQEWIQHEKYFRLMSLRVYGIPKKRGKAEWCILVWFSLVLLLSWLAFPGEGETQGSGGGILLLLLWLLLAFRRFRAWAGIQAWWTLVRLGALMQKKQEGFRSLLFCERGAVIENRNPLETTNTFIFYSAFQRAARDKDRIYFYQDFQHGEVVSLRGFSKEEQDAFWSFIKQSLNGTTLLQKRGIEVLKSGFQPGQDRLAAEDSWAENRSGLLEAEGNQQPKFSVCQRFEEASADEIAEYLFSEERESCRRSEKKTGSRVITVLGYLWLAAVVFFLPFSFRIRIGVLVYLVWRSTLKQSGKRDEKIKQMMKKDWKQCVEPTDGRYLFFEHTFYYDSKTIQRKMLYSDITDWKQQGELVVLVVQNRKKIFLRNDWFEIGKPEDFLVMLDEKTGKNRAEPGRN